MHERIDEDFLSLGGAESDEAKQILVNSDADELNLPYKRSLTAWTTVVHQPFHGYSSVIRQHSSVHFSVASLPNYVALAKIIGR